ncbi:Fusaric acid resistance protein [Candidatus Magnetomorum sp. HK-1]|nr:Fusaric acid resistance protein [Candidatus Magnetomorum sp. HK-1]
MKKFNFLYLLWFFAVIFIVFFSNREQLETHQFFGIAESNEVIVNFEKSVEIKKIYVVPGQKVTKGMLLVELDQPELTLTLNEIRHQLSEYTLQQKIEKKEIQTQIKELIAQKIAKTNAIHSEIKQLQSQHALNKRLTAELKSIIQTSDVSKETEKKFISSPIKLKIESLKEELNFSIQQIDIKIKALKSTLYSDKNPLTAKKASLKKEIELLTTAKEKLLIYSESIGIIGSIHFKRGEKVSPFDTILTIYTQSPSYVKGYIHENVYNRISVDKLVTISSLTGKNVQSDGIVVGVGSRIIEFPERLRKRPETKIWGREVQIKILENNEFLLEEKVVIKSKTKESSVFFIWKFLKNQIQM